MIKAFLESSSALAILGLPGFVLLLAYGFYRSMLSHGVIRPLAQRQGFVVLMTIILYFAIVTILIAVLYRPVRATPAPVPAAAPTHAPAPVSSPAPQPDPLDLLLDQGSLATPADQFEKAGGQVLARSSEGLPEGVTYQRMANDRGRTLVLVSRSGALTAIGGYDPKGTMRIPTMNMGNVDDKGRERTFYRLADFTFKFVLQSCGNVSAPGGRVGGLIVGPCYFGRPGGYNSFWFLFMPGDRAPACITALSFAGEDVATEKLAGCDWDEPATGFVVSGGKEGDPDGGAVAGMILEGLSGFSGY